MIFISMPRIYDTDEKRSSTALYIIYREEPERKAMTRPQNTRGCRGCMYKKKQRSEVRIMREKQRVISGQ